MRDGAFDTAKFSKCFLHSHTVFFSHLIVFNWTVFFSDSSREIVVAARRAPVRLLINKPYWRNKGNGVVNESIQSGSSSEAPYPAAKRNRCNAWRPCLDLEKMIKVWLIFSYKDFVLCCAAGVCRVCRIAFQANRHAVLPAKRITSLRTARLFPADTVFEERLRNFIIFKPKEFRKCIAVTIDYSISRRWLAQLSHVPLQNIFPFIIFGILVLCW
ncbi:unnamed protein product [Angiostrongylus costaricensis]|uniref:F-box domain-containing protein n=1 Tax=Angiostrongylus costaricensis TaxID=334426 RepID=A0A0R3PQ19_ANGCS|nr:unnamed protein product [Angiostrongylus costaricensis]